MNIKFYTPALLLLGLTFFLFSCKSAEKLYENGRYDAAVLHAVKKLKKNSSDEEMSTLLQDAYRMFLQQEETEIQNLSNSSDPLRSEKILGNYQRLQQLYQTIQSSPAALRYVQPVNFSSEINSYKQQSGDVRYERGMALMQHGDKQSYRSAYNEFQQALHYLPNDAMIQTRMNEAFDKAVISVQVMPMTRYSEVPGFYYTDFGSFDRSLFRYLEQNNSNRFIRYSQYGFGMNRQSDHVVDLRFRDVVIGRPRETQSTREVSRRVVTKEIVISKDSVIKEYTTIKAKITTTNISFTTYGLLQVGIRDELGRIIYSDRFRGDYNWATIQTTYTGDERALSDEDKKQLAIKPDRMPPHEHIVRILLAEVQEKAACGIDEFYDRNFR